jgi:rod shape-determining protein MreC
VQRNTAVRGILVTGIILGACVVVFMRYLSFSAGAPERLSSYVVYPFLRMQHALVEPVSTFFEKRKTYAELAAELARVKSERDELVSELAQVLILLDFHDQTDELVRFKKRYEDQNAQLAQVLVKQFSDHQHYFLVDQGSQQGIAVDMVAVYKQCLVGKVTEVYPYYSKVQLITDAQCSVAACCARSRANGIHEGKNRTDGSTLRYVSHLAKVKEGDIVFSSGEGLVFPRGFALGAITTCVKNGLYYDIALKPLFDIQGIQYCYLMRKGASPADVVRVSQALDDGKNPNKDESALSQEE